MFKSSNSAPNRSHRIIGPVRLLQKYVKYTNFVMTMYRNKAGGQTH